MCHFGSYSANQISDIYVPYILILTFISISKMPLQNMTFITLHRFFNYPINPGMELASGWAEQNIAQNNQPKKTNYETDPIHHTNYDRMDPVQSLGAVSGFAGIGVRHDPPLRDPRAADGCA